MSIKLDTSNGHPRVPQIMYTQGSLAAYYRYIVDTKPVRRQTGSVDRKTEKKAEPNSKPSSDVRY